MPMTEVLALILFKFSFQKLFYVYFWLFLSYKNVGPRKREEIEEYINNKDVGK